MIIRKPAHRIELRPVFALAECWRYGVYRLRQLPIHQRNAVPLNVLDVRQQREKIGGYGAAVRMECT